MNEPPIRISIATPCHERWDRMTATDRGAFCQVCSKEVVDFTAMTDAELLAYFEKGDIGCGKLRIDQLYQPPVVQPRYQLRSIFNAMLAVLLPFIGIKTVAAQTAPARSPQHHNVTATSQKADTAAKSQVSLREVQVLGSSRKYGNGIIGQLEIEQTPQQIATERHDTLIMLPPASEAHPDNHKKKK